MSAHRIVPAGDSAVIVEFAARIDVAVNAQAVALAESVRAAVLSGVRDVVPTFCSVAVYFDPLKTDVHLQGVAVCRGGLAAPFSEAELKQKLDAAECEIRVTVRGKGKGAARFWTCDLTEGYIRINASYRT